MPQRPKRRVREAKQALYRGLVLEAAARVFAEKGYDDAKMEEIGRASGLALGTLYSVFAGKAEVFRAIHEAADAELLRRSVERVRGLADPLAVVLEGIRAYAEYFLEHPDFLRMHLREGLSWGRADSARIGRERSDAWNAGVEMLTAAFARCIQLGVFVTGDPRLFARMTIAMQQVQLAHWIESEMATPREALLRELAEQVKRSFCRLPAEGA